MVMCNPSISRDVTPSTPAVIMLLFYIFCIISSFTQKGAFADVLGCGGFVKSDVEINFSLVEVIKPGQTDRYLS